MAEQTTSEQRSQDPIQTAKDAYLLIQKESDRLLFIDWCRRENDKALFRTIDTAAIDAVEELKKKVNLGADFAKEAGAAAIKTGESLLDSLKKGADSLDDKLKDFLGKK